MNNLGRGTAPIVVEKEQKNALTKGGPRLGTAPIRTFQKFSRETAIKSSGAVSDRGVPAKLGAARISAKTDLLSRACGDHLHVYVCLWWKPGHVLINRS